MASRIGFPANATEVFGPYVNDNSRLSTWMSKHADVIPLELSNIPLTYSANWNDTQVTQAALPGLQLSPTPWTPNGKSIALAYNRAPEPDRQHRILL